MSIFLFFAVSSIALFKLMQGFKIVFVSEFKTLDESPDREKYSSKTGERYTLKLDNLETGIKNFYPFKASRAIKLSTLFTLLSYSVVIYSLIENQSIFSIFILWFVLVILYFVSIAPFAMLGNFYQYQEYSDDVEKRERSKGGKKDKRYKGGYKEKPTYSTYFYRKVLYRSPDYLKLWEKNFNLSWIWIFCSTLVIPFI